MFATKLSKIQAKQPRSNRTHIYIYNYVVTPTYDMLRSIYYGKNKQTVLKYFIKTAKISQKRVYMVKECTQDKDIW